MTNQNIAVKPVKELMEESFINYAMSVITGRSLPDIRDGLKPVHRRILFAMHEAGNDYNKAYKKSARMVGDVIGKYHPHGDVSVYDAAVRMAQPFSMNEMMIDGQGNFGSVDGDNPAAMRYTEMRLSRISSEMFLDLDKETVEFQDNYDGSESEPKVLPASYPNLLVNGTEGIAVGMATNIPPHNLSAVIEATLMLLDNSDTEVAAIVRVLQAPDFPTGAIVHDLDGFHDAVDTGRGRIKIRSKWHEEERGRGLISIVIDEIPYQVNKSKLVMKIAELVGDKEIDGIVGLRDESNKDGMRIVIEIRKDEIAEVIFAQLCKKTEIEISNSYNCVVLDHGIPVQIGLKAILEKWLVFRLEVVLKRYIYDRKQALARLHLLSGFMAAIARMDEVIKSIRDSDDATGARAALIELLSIDDIQADAILALRLQKLTGLELSGITNEFNDVTGKVAKLTEVIESNDLLRGVVRAELNATRDRYGKPRRTEIGHGISEVTREDMIPREDIVIVMTKNGYIKRMPASALSAQGRGTRGRRSIEVGEDDEVSAIYEANTHDLIMVFDEDGQVYAVKGYSVPESSLTSKGRHIRQVIPGMDKEIAAIIRVPSDVSGISLLIVTNDGVVKRSSLGEYENAVRSIGLRGINLVGNKIIAAFVAKDSDDMLMVSSAGMAIRFSLDSVRETGRISQGVYGIKLGQDEFVIGAHVVSKDSTDRLVCIGERGVGKRTPISEFKPQGRNGVGVICFNINAKTGPLVSAFGSDDSRDIIMLASNGVSNRVRVPEIRETGRSTSGVHLMSLDKGQTIVSVTTVIHQDVLVEDSVDEGVQ